MSTMIFSILGGLLVGTTIARDGWFAGGQVYLCIGMLRYIITSWEYIDWIVQTAEKQFQNKRRTNPGMIVPSHTATHLLTLAYIVALWWNIGEEKKLP